MELGLHLKQIQADCFVTVFHLILSFGCQDERGYVTVCVWMHRTLGIGPLSTGNRFYEFRGVQLAKNDFGFRFSFAKKLRFSVWFRFYQISHGFSFWFDFLHCVMFNVCV